MIKETPTFFDHLPGGIEASEARGQSALVHSELLPTKMDGGMALYEAMGVRFGSVVKDDPLFIEATLPAGWKKVATSHPLHSHVVDEKGRKRLHVAYKAAYYDRYAHMSAEARFVIDCYGDPDDAPRIGRVKDADSRVLFETEPLARSAKSWEDSDKLNAQCVAWLEANYPDYKNPLAYWDLP